MANDPEKTKQFPFVVALVSFLLGLLSFLFSEFVKRRLERKKVLDLLITDIHFGWKHLDIIRHYPVKDGEYVPFKFWEFEDIEFKGTPHFNFEVYNLELLKTEGLNLAKVLKRPAREKIWHVYQLTKRTEDVRKYLLKEDADSVDYQSYEKLFNQLVNQLADEILALSKELYKEKYWGKAVND